MLDDWGESIQSIQLVSTITFFYNSTDRTFENGITALAFLVSSGEALVIATRHQT